MTVIQIFKSATASRCLHNQKKLNKLNSRKPVDLSQFPKETPEKKY
jgi:hypothetical protein